MVTTCQADQAVTVFEDRGDAERGRRFDDEASVVEEHPHAGDDPRLLDQDGVVSEQEEVVQDGRTPLFSSRTRETCSTITNVWRNTRRRLVPDAFPHLGHVQIPSPESSLAN